MAVKAAVVGCGKISRFHFSGLEKAGADVRWVCDLSEDAARPWAERFGARMTADYREALDDADVDAVVVCTLSSTHKDICLAAIDAGKAVICEKTLSTNGADALAIVQAAEARGTIFYTSYMKRFIPAVEKAKELLPSIGPVVSTWARSYQNWGNLIREAPAEGPFAAPADGAASFGKAHYGGGALPCAGSHILDLLNFFLGRPRRLWARVAEPAGRDYDVQAAALMETDNGVAHFEALAHPLTKIGFLRDGWDERIEINGLDGRLELFSSLWNQPESKASLLVHTDERAGRATEYRYAPESPFDRAVAFFLGNIERGEQGAQSRATGYEVDALMDAVFESGRTGRAVEMDWKV